MALGLIGDLYKDREKCTTVGDTGRFFLSDLCFLHRGDRVVDFFGEDAQREVVGCVFSSRAIKS
jgi:hypothetical protein